MDEFERRSLYNCRQEFYNDVDVDDFLLKLQQNGSITEKQRSEIEKNGTKKEKTVRLLQHLSFRADECYQDILHILKDDYPLVARKLEHALLIERTSFSKDVNERLIEIINDQLVPIVYGGETTKQKSELDDQDIRPRSSLSRLSDLVSKLQHRCLKILNEPANKTPQSAIPVLINRKIKEQQDIVQQLKKDIHDIKLLPKRKKGFDGPEELTPSAKIFQLRQELQQQHERVRLLKHSLMSKESKVTELKEENAVIQNQIHELRKLRSNGNIHVSPMFDDDI